VQFLSCCSQSFLWLTINEPYHSAAASSWTTAPGERSVVPRGDDVAIVAIIVASIFVAIVTVSSLQAIVFVHPNPALQEEVAMVYGSPQGRDAQKRDCTVDSTAVLSATCA